MEFSPSPWPWDASFTFVVFGMFDLGRGVRSSLGVKPLIALVETAYLFHSPYQLIPVRETRVEEPNLKTVNFSPVVLDRTILVDLFRFSPFSNQLAVFEFGES